MTIEGNLKCESLQIKCTRNSITSIKLILSKKILVRVFLFFLKNYFWSVSLIDFFTFDLHIASKELLFSNNAVKIALKSLPTVHLYFCSLDNL